MGGPTSTRKTRPSKPATKARRTGDPAARARLNAPEAHGEIAETGSHSELQTRRSRRVDPRRPGRWPGAPASDAGPAHAPRGCRRPADDGPPGSTDEGRCPRRPRSSPPPGGRGEPEVHRDERRPAAIAPSRVEVPLFPGVDGGARPSCRRERRHLVDEVQELAHELRLPAAPDFRSVGVASRRAASARAGPASGMRGSAPVRIASAGRTGGQLPRGAGPTAAGGTARWRPGVSAARSGRCLPHRSR
jgi:hypothetical protein